jgi:Kef-type K+ transport system membrane component KefB
LETPAEILISIGAIFLLGLIADALGRKTFLPRVTLLLIFGVVIGQSGLGLIPEIVIGQFELIADVALVVIGFLLGGQLTPEKLRHAGKALYFISIGAVLGSVLVVATGLWLIGTPFEVSLLLGCIAVATAPAATVDVVLESGKQTRFTEVLLLIVAVDDAWGLILFSLALVVVGGMLGNADNGSLLVNGTLEIGGAILLGCILGFPGAFLTGRIRPGQPTLIEAMGLVFLCAGIAVYLEVSFLIASMVMGAIIANFATHHERSFSAVENMEWPLLVVFFILAGASLEIDALRQVGLLGMVYAICRIVGKWFGATVGAKLAGSDKMTRRWIGVALLPQAGAAIGMALMASYKFPEYQQLLLTAVISTTVFFEIIGPVFARLAIRKTS